MDPTARDAEGRPKKTHRVRNKDAERIALDMLARIHDLLDALEEEYGIVPEEGEPLHEAIERLFDPPRELNVLTGFTARREAQYARWASLAPPPDPTPTPRS